MSLLQKSLFGITGMGVLALVGSQALGTVTSLSFFDHMSQMSSEQQIQASETNSKFAEVLKDPKYQDILADPYFTSTDFTSKNSVYLEGDKAYDEALNENLKDIKENIVDRYPLSEGSYNQMKDVVTKHVVIDMESYQKFRVAKDAEGSCNPAMNVTDPQAVALGKKYFCP